MNPGAVPSGQPPPEASSPPISVTDAGAALVSTALANDGPLMVAVHWSGASGPLKLAHAGRAARLAHAAPSLIKVIGFMEVSFVVEANTTTPAAQCLVAESNVFFVRAAMCLSPIAQLGDRG
jgi:hypothetical protein